MLFNTFQNIITPHLLKALLNKYLTKFILSNFYLCYFFHGTLASLLHSIQLKQGVYLCICLTNIKLYIFLDPTYTLWLLRS